MKFTDSNPNLFKNVAKDLKNLDKVIYKEVSHMRNVIQKRTQAGEDVDNNKFKQYTTQYLEWKRKAKDRIKPVSHPDLTLTGALLNSMKPKKITGGGIIHFIDASENDKANWVEAMGYEFFAISDQQEKNFFRNLNKAIINGK